MRAQTKIYIFFFGFILSLFPLSAENTDINAASDAYRNGNFKKSIELYEIIVDSFLKQGEESAELYYNLGNAYFRDNQIGKAILNFERALLLDPGDADIRHNLRFANLRTEDKIDTTQNLFFVNWFRSIQNMFNSNTWATIAIILFIFFLGCAAMYLFVRILWAKKVAFYTNILIFVLLIAANVFSFRQKDLRQNHSQAIILTGAVTAMSSPDKNSTEVFQLHEGTKVKITGTDGIWYEVEIANGSVGWLNQESVEII